MEKYGVEQGHRKVAAASSNARCPRCGKNMNHAGAVLICPSCGTEPLEEKHDKSKDRESVPST
jgi:tRNA(Ile2) C34 agmatinyltransferase TiaS